MISDLAIQVGKFLPERLKVRLLPAFAVLNSTERYLTYKINKRRADRFVTTTYGFDMAIDTSDSVQRRYITDDGKGEANITDLMSDKIKNLNSGDFIDIGANVGFYSLMFCQYNKCNVYAFEPLSYNTRRFIKNMELNGFDNYNLFSIGLSDHNYKSEIYYHPYNKGDGGVVSNSDDLFFLQSELVSFDTLDNIRLGSDDISLMKIDVEGHELDVIIGAEKTIRQQMPEILVEIHPKRLQHNGQSLESFLSKIFEIGYSSVYLIEDGVSLKEQEAMKSLEQVKNNHGVLFVP